MALKGKRKNRLKSSPVGFVNKIKVEDLVKWCYDQITDSRNFKDTLIPDKVISGGKFADWLLALNKWAKGEKKIPDGVTFSGEESIVTGENHIWTQMDTLGTTITEKDYQISHLPEGPEDSSLYASKVNAVRSHEWDADGCADTLRDMMQAALWKGSSFAAEHATKMVGVPKRTRTIMIDLLALHWEPRAKNIEDAMWVEYSEYMLASEISDEWNIKVPDKDLGHDEECDYDINIYAAKKGLVSEYSKPPKKYKGDPQVGGRVHYFWIYDAEIKREKHEILEDVNEALEEEVILPAIGEDELPLTPEDVGLTANAEIIDRNGTTHFREMVPLTDEQGNQRTQAMLKPAIGEDGKPKFRTDLSRKYPNGRLIVFVGKTMLYDGGNPYEMKFLNIRSDKRYFPIPLFWIHNHKIPDRVLGISSIELALDDQISINIADNTIRLNAKYSGSSPAIVEEKVLVSPESPEDLDNAPNNVIVMKKGKMGLIGRLKQESLPQQFYAFIAAKIQHLWDLLGTSRQLISGVAPASDPAQKTEFLTTLVMRRQTSLFRGAHLGAKRWEEIRVSHDYQQGDYYRIAETDKQNVVLEMAELENYHARIRMRVIDSSDTRRERQLARLARFGEQANQLIMSVPGGAEVYLKTFMEMSDVPEFTQNLKEFQENAQAQQQQTTQGEDVDSGKNAAPLTPVYNTQNIAG